MAAPAEININDLTGSWVMNKTTSDDFLPVLALQGVGYLKRKILGYVTVTLVVKHHKDSSDIIHIDIEQVATGNFKGTTELRTLNWVKQEHTDDLFGAVIGQSRFISDLAAGQSGGGGSLDPYLLEGWEKEGEFVQTWAESVKDKWVAEQIWGFAIVNGQRQHVRRVVVKKGAEALRVKLVYDWQGKS